MNQNVYITKKKLLSIALILIFAIICIIIACLGPKRIIDIDTPLSSAKVEAMFYAVFPDSDQVTCLGDGLINTTEEKSGERAVASAIVTAPDYSAYAGEDYYIAWNSIRYAGNEYRVYGTVMHGSPSSKTITNVFSNVAELKKANLQVGDYVATDGYFMANDGGASEYLISANADSNALDNIKLSNGLYAVLQLNSVLENIKQLGVIGDGVSDDSKLITAAVTNNPNVFFPKGTYKISLDCASLLSNHTLNGEGTLKLAKWSKQWVAGKGTNVYDGTCEISKMNDPIYMAAHWPSEALMTEDGRNNICVATNINMSDSIRKICYHGAVVRVKDVEIPDTFTICLGKGQLYAYKNNQWTLLNESFPSFRLYDASWTNPSMAVPSSNIKRFDDHIEVTLTKDLWYPNNDEMLLHYFCQSYALADGENASDYQYYFANYTAWAKDPAYAGCFSFGVSADMRDRQDKIYELGIGKMYLLEATPRTSYFYNVPDSKYDQLIKPYFK